MDKSALEAIKNLVKEIDPELFEEIEEAIKGSKKESSKKDDIWTLKTSLSVKFINWEPSADDTSVKFDTDNISNWKIIAVLVSYIAAVLKMMVDNSEKDKSKRPELFKSIVKDICNNLKDIAD